MVTKKPSINYNYQEEKQYANVLPGILIEEYLGENLQEYKFNMIMVN